MFDFLKWGQKQELEPVQFIPTVQIHPKTTLFIECTPNDPNTSSNIVINSYMSKTNRTILQTRIKWSRFKFVTENQNSIEQLPSITGNAYRCEPADLGSYIRAKITSFDVSCSGEAEITIGPIKLDPSIKPLVEGALYSKNLRSQIKVHQKNAKRQVDMILTDNYIKFTDIAKNEELKMAYDIKEPRIQFNPKDPTKIFLRFENDSKNTVKNWLNLVFHDSMINPFNDNQSMKSHNSASSKSKLFKGLHCANKIEIFFLNRHCRDQFIFSIKSFICKQSMKDTIVMQNIQYLQQMKTPIDVHKFFQFMSLKYEIFRLSELAKQFQNDRDQKVKDITDLQQSIGEMTLTYTKIIEQKGKLSHIDFNQSYSEISIKKQQIMGRKQMRQLFSQNDQLKIRVRQLNEELQLAKFFKKQNNDSMLFNQTNNPFIKKNAGDSMYNPIMAQQLEDDMNSSRFQKGNMQELVKSNMDLRKQNQKLRHEKKVFQNNNMSRDMMDLLESLHEEDEDPAKVMKNQKIEIQKLEQQIKVLNSKNNQLAEQAKKMKMQPKLNQSIAHQQSMQQSFANQSNLYSQKDSPSFYSINTSNMNQSMTSQAGIMMLEQKLSQISQTNKKILVQNQRIRKQRNYFRSLYEKVGEQNKLKVKEQSKEIKPNKVFQNMQESQIFDKQNFDKLQQEKQLLANQNKNLKNKIDSFSKETNKLGSADSLLQKKCQSLTKQNNYLRQQNQSLKNKVDLIKEQIDKRKEINTGSQGETSKMKKINNQLLQQIKNMKIQLQRKSEPLYDSRIIQLENQINFYKGKEDGLSYESPEKKLVDQISKLQKTVEQLKRECSDKDSKLASQQALIQRLMSQHEQSSANSVSGKDKSYSETRNESSQNTQKLRKKVRQLQEQIILMRRSSDALNRSKDISMQMQDYNQERLEIMQKQRESLLQQNERLSRMCEKYAKDAREAVKWKKQYLEAVKNNKKQQPNLDL